jgi:hypothetical protein
MIHSHEVATRAIVGTVLVAAVRGPANGIAHFAVSYESCANHWLSRHEFTDLPLADAGALTFGDFTGVEVR